MVTPVIADAVGTVARTGHADLDRALAAPDESFRPVQDLGLRPRNIDGHDGELLRSRTADIAPLRSMERARNAAAMAFDVTDLDSATRILAASNFCNAGQVCISPPRFLVHDSEYDHPAESSSALSGKS